MKNINWKKIIVVQLVIISSLIIAEKSVSLLSNKINEVANQYNTNYTSINLK